MHHVAAACALVVASVLAVPASASAAAEGATIDKTGWWNRANTPTATPAGPVTVPPPPDVPAGDLAVGAFGAEASAIAAVGIQPDDGPGSTIESLSLTLVEDPEAGNRSTDTAAIVACPITSFWAGGENGAWETKPEHDCEAAKAHGTRGDDGTWTFDLTAIAELWADPAGSIRADGVALVPDLEAEPGSFQVVWAGGDAIDVRLDSEPAEAAGDPFGTPSSGGSSSGGFGGSPAGAIGSGGGSLFTPPRITTPPAIGGDVPALEDGPTETADEPGEDEVAGAPVVDDRPARGRAGDLIGNWPAAGFLLVPLLAAVLLATSYWLGPAGEPTAPERRGGVSRALAARSRTSQER